MFNVRRIVQLIVAVQMIQTLQACSNKIKLTEVSNSQDIVDDSGIQQITIKDLSRVHSKQVLYTFTDDQDSETFKELMSAVKSSEWVESSLQINDIQKSKGQYLGLLQYSNGSTKYSVCMNEVRMEDVSSEPFEDMMDAENQLDSDAVAYFIDMQDNTVYETYNQNVQNILLKIGNSHQVDREVKQFIFQTSENYGIHSYYKYDPDFAGVETRDLTAKNLMTYLVNYFSTMTPNLQDKLDAYQDLNQADYNCSLVVYDSLGYAMYSMYLLNDNTVRIFDYTNGNSWIDSQNETAENLSKCIDVFKI